MTKDVVTRVASELLQARREQRPIPPIASPSFDLTDAYAAQLQQVQEWTSQKRQIAGYKVGLTSATMQAQLGVAEPDFGHLFADEFHLSGEAIPFSTFIQPRVEPEIAFVLGRSLTGPGVTVAEAIQAVDYAVASLEIIDSRIEDWKISLVDTVADNASAGAVVLGTQPVKLEDLDLRLIGTILRRNGNVIQTGAGAAVMGSPLSALVWLANTLGKLGTTLEAGSVVLPGSVTAAISAARGDAVSADFATLGSAVARFN